MLNFTGYIIFCMSLHENNISKQKYVYNPRKKYYNQQPCMAKILRVHVIMSSLTCIPFNTCILNTESLYCVHFQSNE